MWNQPVFKSSLFKREQTRNTGTHKAQLWAESGIRLPVSNIWLNQRHARLLLHEPRGAHLPFRCPTTQAPRSFSASLWPRDCLFKNKTLHYIHYYSFLLRNTTQPFKWMWQYYYVLTYNECPWNISEFKSTKSELQVEFNIFCLFLYIRTPMFGKLSIQGRTEKCHGRGGPKWAWQHFKFFFKLTSSMYSYF